jgi:prophage regulatory protein
VLSTEGLPMPRRATRTNTTKSVTYSATQPTYSATQPTYSAKTQHRVLRIRQVCERTGLARSTIYKAVADGVFPAPVSILGAKASGWIEAEVNAFLEGRFAARDQQMA